MKRIASALTAHGMLLLAMWLAPARAADAPVAQAAPAPSATQAANAPAGQKAFLWEVRSLTNKMYLYGTVHVGKPTFFPLPAGVEKAFAESDRLVVEADVTNQEAVAATAPLVVYAPPQSIETHMPAAMIERLKVQLERHNLPYQAVRSFKPFAIGGLLAIAEYGKLGYDQRHGVDGYLLNKAILGGKPLGELESVMDQMSMMTDLSKEEQEAFLDNSLTSLEQGRAPEQITGLVNSWLAGDAELMELVVRDANEGLRMSEELDEKILYSRNAGMANKLEAYLHSREVIFAAVGAMHMVGKRGLPALLKSKGYRVTQLQASP